MRRPPRHPSTRRVDSLAILGSFAFAVPLVSALAACGGRVDLEEPNPTTSGTATSTATASTSATVPTTSATLSNTTSPPPPPPPLCDPAACVLPNTASATCVAGRCAPAACADGFADCDANPANGCEAALQTTFPDEDGDGFGDGARPTRACPKAGVAYVSNGDDCYDQNFYARPGQTGFFTTDRGDGSFDYDCNSTNERRVTTLQVYCNCSGGSCSINQGWIGTVPDCGESGAWATGPLGGTCEPVRELRGQACR